MSCIRHHLSPALLHLLILFPILLPDLILWTRNPTAPAGKGGEQEGDALRACTSWSQGFSAAGATADISMFAGSIKLRKSIFDCTLAPWEKVVEALTSNTAERSKTVTLIFEREVE